MIKFSKNLIMLMTTLLFLSGCTGTGGTLGNLIPLPKIMQGTVENGTYFAPDQSFSIATPHVSEGNGDETYEWTYAKVKEGGKEGLQFVEFGPFAFDQNTYSVDVFQPPKGLTLNVAAENYFKNKLKDSANKYELLAKAEIQIKGRNALYQAWLTESDFILVATFINFGEKYANVFSLIRPQTIPPISKDNIRNQTWPLYNKFVESLEVPAIK